MGGGRDRERQDRGEEQEAAEHPGSVGILRRPHKAQAKRWVPGPSARRPLLGQGRRITTSPTEVRARTSTVSADGSGASAASRALWT